MIIIDATNLILGRLSTFAAKQALLGEEVIVVNCEKALVTGSREVVLARFHRKLKFGAPLTGPYYPKQPDRMVRRTIRGMLPRKKPHGKEVFKHVMCYLGVPDEYGSKEIITLEGANISKLGNLKYMSLAEVAKNVGGRQ